ncbi:hypothetical protein [Amycolatopsis pithecellobii]|uniref:Uncharacterized protein n=1 Tax=Amycolatopsis pithecellobii TaxID=664692 RepID=A0A6N7Z8D8_9PSEU|nr:hypothetical protein [Amycolatopsis pithecellobii]MTD57750.1 hypothetical protein [Amycolatopsis pithecellobii]
MSAGEHLLVAGVGYLLAIALLVAGIRWKATASRASVVLRVLAGLVATTTTLSWLGPAATSGGPVGGLFMFLLLFVFVPFVLTYAAQRLRPLRKGEEPLWPYLVAGIGGLAMLVPGLVSTADGALHLVGLAHHVDLTITDVVNSTDHRRGVSLPSTAVSGDYRLGGQVRHLDDSEWLKFGPDPVPGQVYPVTISLLWPTAMIESTETALVFLGFGLGCSALGGYFVRSAFVREKKRSPGGKARGSSR